MKSESGFRLAIASQPFGDHRDGMCQFFPTIRAPKAKHSPNQEKGSRSWHPPFSIYNTKSLLNNLTNASTGRDKKVFFRMLLELRCIRSITRSRQQDLDEPVSGIFVLVVSY